MPLRVRFIFRICSIPASAVSPSHLRRLAGSRPPWPPSTWRNPVQDENESHNAGNSNGVAEYKTILQRVLESRPSGTRQRIAAALSKNRSFVTQITSPAYDTPIPAKHVDLVLEICHFAPAEREAFLAAYRRAHPNRHKL